VGTAELDAESAYNALGADDATDMTLIADVAELIGLEHNGVAELRRPRLLEANAGQPVDPVLGVGVGRRNAPGRRVEFDPAIVGTLTRAARGSRLGRGFAGQGEEDDEGERQ